MSKLIDLIGRLGQQSAQQIGFSALAGKSGALPTMALIASTSATTVIGDLKAVGPEVVDAVVLESDDDLSGAESNEFQDLTWGVVSRSMNNDGLESLVAAGCDFLLGDLQSIPAAAVSYPDLAVILALEEPVDRETSCAIQSLGVAGSWNVSGVGMSEVGFEGLVAAAMIGASTGGVMLINGTAEMSVSDLTALRDAGVDAVVVPLEDHELVRQFSDSISKMPPRRRSESRRLAATAPRGKD